MKPAQRSYEAALEKIKGTTFEAALEHMDPDERVRAQRLRDGFKLRADDALWVYCGLIKGMEAILHETLKDCITGMDEELRTSLGEQLGKRGCELVHHAADSSPSKAALTSFRVRLACLGSLFVASIILTGSAGVTFGVMAGDGQVPWVPPSAGLGSFSYAAAAILTAPTGGFFAIVGLLMFGLMVAIFRYINSPVPMARTQ